MYIYLRRLQCNSTATNLIFMKVILFRFGETVLEWPSFNCMRVLESAVYSTVELY